MAPNRYLLVSAALFGMVLASSGDVSSAFKICVDRCDTARCQTQQPLVLPLTLRLTFWTCIDDCQYNCMHEITSEAIERGAPVEQYHGKWPFWRFAGMQEPASVAFSLLNLWSYVLGARKIKKRVPSNHPMKGYYLVWSFVCINAWVWSSVFHTRGKSQWNTLLSQSDVLYPDFPFTEKMDYFSAALSILYALYYTVIRLFHLYPHRTQARLTTANAPPQTRFIKEIWALFCVIAYLAHISYLTFLPRFDYTYNMAFNLIVGLVHNALWLTYALPISLIQGYPNQPKSHRPPFVINAAVFVVLTTAATSLELFDFPPWAGIIDAHALWHLVTAPIALFWFDFLVADALDSNWRDQKM